MSNIVARTYRPRDERAMNEVIQKSFKSGTANAYPLPPSRFVVIGELDGKVVGHTSIRPMLFYAGGAIIRTGVLHMVGTDPAYQHKGIGHTILDKVNEIMRNEGLVLSILGTPVPRFYAPKGWEEVGIRREISVSRAIIEAYVKKMVEKLEIRDGSLDHLNDYVILHERMARKYWFFVHANTEFMKMQAQKACQGSLTEFFHEIWSGGNLVGYVLGSRDASVKEGEPLKITVQELALDQYTPELVASIYKELLAYDEEFQSVAAGPNVVPELTVALKGLGGMVKRLEGVDMVRINMVKEFLVLIRDQLDSTLATFLQQNKRTEARDVVFNVDGERVLLAYRNDHLAVHEREGNSHHSATFALSRNDLVRVVTGGVAPSTLVKEGKARCDSRAVLDQLDAMFPPQPVTITSSNAYFQALLPEMGIALN